MSFLLDTNILSAHLRRPSGLAHRFIQHSGRLYTTNLCIAELYAWAYGRANPAPTLAAIEQLVRDEVGVIELDVDCAREYGRLRVALRSRGVSVASVDLLIAAVALQYDLTLVTHNTRDFENIPQLRLQDWLKP